MEKQKEEREREQRKKTENEWRSVKTNREAE